MLNAEKGRGGSWLEYNQIQVQDGPWIKLCAIGLWSLILTRRIERLSGGRTNTVLRSCRTLPDSMSRNGEDSAIQSSLLASHDILSSR